MRHLLAKLGVDRQQISDFLHSQSQKDLQSCLVTIETEPQAFLLPMSRNADSKHEKPTSSQVISPIQLATPPSSSENEAPVTVQPDSSSRKSNHRRAAISELLPLSGFENINGESACDTGHLSLNSVALDQSLLPSVSDCFCPELAQDQSTEDETESMSCEAAASIIAGIRGHGDEELALIELGCEQDVNCQIKNIQVLQVMGID
jgi:hypothetical protein